MKHSDKPNDEILWDLIQDMRFGMLSHRHADGSLHSHPLTTQNRDLKEGSLFFFVSRKTEVGTRLRQDGNVNVAYANPDKDTYVSVTGQARIVESLDKKKELFNVIAKAWFPGGAEDPDLELVQVVIDEAEFWNVKENKLLQLIKMGKAAATGHPPKDMGDHAEVKFGTPVAKNPSSVN